MSTTNTSTNQYNPAAYSTYQAFQPQLQSSLMSSVANPFGSSQFQNQLAQQQGSARQMSQLGVKNNMQNVRAGGGVLGNSAGFLNANLQRSGIAASGMQSNAFNSAVNTALNTRGQALSMMQAYQPLQTGQTSTTSGAGTWLPQVAGMGLNMLAPGLGSMLGGGSFSGGYKANGGSGGGGGYSGPPASGSAFGGVTTPNYYMQQNYPNGSGTPSF